MVPDPVLEFLVTAAALGGSEPIPFRRVPFLHGSGRLAQPDREYCFGCHHGHADGEPGKAVAGVGNARRHHLWHGIERNAVERDSLGAWNIRLLTCCRCSPGSRITDAHSKLHAHQYCRLPNSNSHCHADD